LGEIKMEERTKVKEIGNYNPQTGKYEDSFRDAETGDPVTEPLDIHKVPTIGKYNPSTGLYEPETEDRAPEGEMDLTEDV